MNTLLLEACKNIYRQKQINFNRKFYHKIYYKNVRENFQINDIGEIIADEWWIKEKEFVIPTDKSIPPELNIGKKFI